MTQISNWLYNLSLATTNNLSYWFVAPGNVFYLSILTLYYVQKFLQKFF